MTDQPTTFVAKATIHTEHPLSISMPVAEYTKPNKWDNFPVMQVGGFGEGEEPQLTGYLPATTIRGALRRHAVIHLMTAAADEGKHYTLDKTYMDMIGQDAKSEKQPDEIDLVAVRKEREENPVVDLFGSGLGVKSRLTVSHFFPAHPVEPQPITAVRKDLEDAEGVLELLGQDDRNQYIGRGEANRRRAQSEKNLKDLNREKRKRERNGEDLGDLNEQIAATERLVEKYKSEMGEMQVSTRSIFTHYALPKGLDLQGEFVIRNFRDRDLDILKRSLNGFSQMPILGAQSARGCGRVSGRIEYSLNGEDHIIKFGDSNRWSVYKSHILRCESSSFVSAVGELPIMRSQLSLVRWLLKVIPRRRACRRRSQLSLVRWLLKANQGFYGAD